MVNKKIIKVLMFIVFLFVLLIGHLTYFIVFKKDEVSQNSHNKRLWAYEEDIVRGEIADRNGIVLAFSKEGERIYNYNSLYCHVIGYNSKIYGKTNIESKFNSLLLGRGGLTEVFNLSGDGKVGYDLTLTIDHRLQHYAYGRLGNANGSIVAINPQTGEVLALVSKPDFDPSNAVLIKKWTELTENSNSPLLARATSGLYPPGSTFKIITSAAAIEKGMDNDMYSDTGSVIIGNTAFYNYGKKANGEIDFKKAFALSSNFAFCSMGAALTSPTLRDMAQRFGFDKTFDFDIDFSKSAFAAKDTDEAGSAALAIGQGETLATPLQMALTACAVANDGVIMKPYIVQKATNKNGNLVYEKKPQQLYKPITSEVSEKIKDLMVETVKTGTGKNAGIRNISVAGKTGTAENELLGKENNKEHAWFVGFAPADDSQIVVAVMLEYSGGSGGELCAPIARDIINTYLKK
ncbi:MAG: penicillin-binding transpeptidase domain-containing protein [Firmicutes bacterium]|nr:penicillin-binding transpeptidase domain-containing protein [Bacillota bacterium]